MVTANAPIAQWDDFLEEGFLFKIVISMENEYRTKPKKY